ncbi:nucleotide-diphospho-sugar transferase [Dichotomocladium elegans]|nr:nucleotide-diphospho-sugar transferase [Dichotomocladium elegans]
MHWTFPLKLLYSIFVSCIFVVPAVIGYAIHLRITKQAFWVLGVYGTVVFCFLVLQLIFATLNRVLLRRHRQKHPPPVSASEPKRQDGEQQLSQQPKNVRCATKIGLAVVGYREEPALFAQCLESIQRLSYPDPFKIVVVVDGKDQEDHEMASIYEKAFPGHPVVVLPYLMSEKATSNRTQEAGNDEKKIPVEDDQTMTTHFEEKDCQDNNNSRSSSSSSPSSMKELPPEEPTKYIFYPGDDPVPLPTSSRAVCYLQPHRGKRHAMYTAFRILMAAGCDAIMSTDSDTKFDSQALIELERALYWYPNVGAAAGDVRIWNSGDSLLSFMSSLRYWMAFNIERAAQSFNRCVTCVSGPMGLYKSDVIAELLDDWIVQRFLGQECTYGDDRHLTNRVLLRGYRVVYTHYAFCETETPTNFLRWFKQQTRWSKSFYREILWNALSIHKHSPWMAAELFYQGIYPFVLLFSIFFILWTHAPFVLAVWIVSLVATAFIKTVYSFIVTRSPRFLVFPVYGGYYLLGLVPAKLWALVSLWDVGWGTSARSASERKSESRVWLQIKEALPVVVWILVVFAGIAYNLTAFFLKIDSRSPLSPRPSIGSSGNSIDVPAPDSIIFYPNPNIYS